MTWLGWICVFLYFAGMGSHYALAPLVAPFTMGKRNVWRFFFAIYWPLAGAWLLLMCFAMNWE